MWCGSKLLQSYTNAHCKLSIVLTTAILLQDFYSSFPLTNYAISSYTTVPKYHFRQHAHTHWLLPVVHSSSPEPLVHKPSFYTVCFSLSEKLTKIFCIFRLMQEKMKPSTSWHITNGRGTYILLPVGSV